MSAASYPPSLMSLLLSRGHSPETMNHFLNPSLDSLGPPDRFVDMGAAVERLRSAIKKEETVALYADRDMDGLAGLSVLYRTLRTLGARVIWEAPRHGRGLEPQGLESLLSQGARLFIFIDCGTGEPETLTRLSAQGCDVMVADHHRISGTKARILAWIHPEGTGEKPAGCVMAFKLAQALWLSFLGPNDPERLDYFLYSHLDVVALGILGDRMPLVGENRTLVWHGLRRLAQTRKTGLSALLRFFRLTPHPQGIRVRDASWRIIPMLNAAGRLGEPQWTVDLLTTEDPWTARQAIDQLIALNGQRRTAQDRSVLVFEKMIEEQCSLDHDPVLVARAAGLEPSVTGLAAQAMARKYGRPAVLFVEQGEEAVGSARGLDENDLFAWVETHKEWLIKFGGHEGAVGMTVKLNDYDALRRGLLGSARHWQRIEKATLAPEVTLSLADATPSWWDAFEQLEPFGPGHLCPAVALCGVDRIEELNRRKVRSFLLSQGAVSWPAEWDGGLSPQGEGPWTVIAYPQATPKTHFPFQWNIQEVRQTS